MDSVKDDGISLPPGCPIRKSPGLCFLSSSPKLIAGIHVLLRLLMPRHPPAALNSLTINLVTSWGVAALFLRQLFWAIWLQSHITVSSPYFLKNIFKRRFISVIFLRLSDFKSLLLDNLIFSFACQDNYSRLRAWFTYYFDSVRETKCHEVCPT